MGSHWRHSGLGSRLHHCRRDEATLLGAASGDDAVKFFDLGLDDDFLKAVGDSLGPNSSAIVALVDFEQVDRAMEELEKFEGGRILRHSLSDDVYVKLSEAVEDT